jgi:serine/threonine-protein kinase RsbW
LWVDKELILELPNDIRSIEHAVEYVTRHCTTCSDYARRLNLNFRVGLTEALSNAMLYGNGSDPQKRVRVEVDVGTKEVAVRVTDQGTGFDPSAVPDPTLPGNITKTGGRGIFLMKALMDEVRFNDQGNSVTLVLRFEGEASA